jgi:4-hydroxy-3-methylbut-2-enyl diphosphate reductase
MALAEHEVVYSLGNPIHNPQEVERLEKHGLKLLENASEAPEGAVCFVRAHGVSRAELEELRKRSRIVIDGTCPYVKVAQQRAESLSEEGYTVVVVGDSNHPEVRGIIGHIDGDSIVLSGESEIKEGARYKRLGILSQTTQKESSFVAVVSNLVLITGEIKVYNTICGATIERQKSIRRLAPQVDGIVVIGGKNSANTRKLAEIAESLGVSVMWIEHSGELDRRWLEGKRSIGVAAGGSTPDWLIKDLTCKLQTL